MSICWLICLSVMKLFSGKDEVIRTCWAERQDDECHLDAAFEMPPATLMPKGVDYNELRRGQLFKWMCFCNEDFCNGEFSIIKLFIYVLKFNYSPPVHTWHINFPHFLTVFLNPFSSVSFLRLLFISRFLLLCHPSWGVRVSAVGTPVRSRQRPQLVLNLVNFSGGHTCPWQSVSFASLQQRSEFVVPRTTACFYPRDAMLARVFATATCLSVCLSVRPSVPRRYCA